MNPIQIKKSNNVKYDYLFRAAELWNKSHKTNIKTTKILEVLEDTYGGSNSLLEFFYQQSFR